MSILKILIVGRLGDVSGPSDPRLHFVHKMPLGRTIDEEDDANNSLGAVTTDIIVEVFAAQRIKALIAIQNLFTDLEEELEPVDSGELICAPDTSVLVVPGGVDPVLSTKWRLLHVTDHLTHGLL